MQQPHHKAGRLCTPDMHGVGGCPHHIDGNTSARYSPLLEPNIVRSWAWTWVFAAGITLTLYHIVRDMSSFLGRGVESLTMQCGMLKNLRVLCEIHLTLTIASDAEFQTVLECYVKNKVYGTF